MEQLDDISLWKASTPHEVDQLKHSVNSTSFSDSAPQVWRTLANWAALLQSPALVTSTLRLVLITNASVADGTALSKLGVDDAERDVEGAIALLREVASSSTNATSAGDRKTFLDLDETARQRLISAITVVPDEPGLAALGTDLDEVLFYACESDQLVEFREELEGWWLQRIASELGGGQPTTIPLLEVDGKVSFLRSKYKRSLLTIDVDRAEGDSDGPMDHLFIRQMEAVKVNAVRLKNAQRDFLRAGTQRSRWIRDLKLDPAELTRYDAELEEHWSAKYAILQDDLGATPIEDDKVQAGRTLLGWAEMQQVPIRGAQAQFLTSGSYHTLADQMRVGWHPDFQTLFEKP